MSDNGNSLNSLEKVGLKRTIGFWPVVFFGVLAMGPGGGMTYFPILQPMSNGYCYLSFLIAACIMILSVLSYQKMVQTFPETGSAYAYTSKGLGPKIGFIVGWVLLIDYGVVPMFTLYLNAMYFTEIFGLPEEVFVFLFSILITAACIVGLKLSTSIQIIIGIAAFLVVLILEFGAVKDMFANGINLFHTDAIYDSDKIVWGGVLNGTAIAFMAMLGFDGMTTLAEETTMTPKKMSKAVLVAVLIQEFFLITSTYLMGAVMDWQTIPEENFDTAYMYMLELFTDPAFAAILVVINNVSILACIMSFFTISSRILFSMGRNGAIPKAFAKLNPKTETPVFSILFVFVVCTAGALFIPWEVTAELISYGGCVAFLFVNISVIVYFWFRKKEKIFRNLLIPALAAISIAVVICSLAKITLTVGIIWTIIGILYLLINYKVNKSFRDSIDSGSLEMEG